MTALCKLHARQGPGLVKLSGIHARPLYRPAARVCAGTSSGGFSTASMSKTALRKLPKAILESKLKELGHDARGNKEALIERLMASSQQITIESSKPAEAQEAAHDEVGILRAEVTRLQMELAATTEKLEAASAAADAERLELGQLGSAMAQLRAEHEEEHAQLQAAEAAAAEMHRSCEEVEALRGRQADLAESIALMQSLLEERDAEIELLRRQLEEFAVKATAPAAAAVAGMEGGIAIAERPAEADWDIPASWRPAQPSSLSGGVAFEVDVEGALRAEGVPAQELDVAKKHGAPLMLAIAGGQAAAQAYMAVRSSLPKTYHIAMDATATVAGCMLLYAAAYA